MNFEEIIMGLANRKRAAQAALDTIFKDPEREFEIDEVALMFVGNPWPFLEEAVKLDGVDLFNVADDEVETFPIHRDYSVRYYFLSTPFGFRVECMRITGGISPLHNGFIGFDGSTKDVLPPVVHYSFKCADETEYKYATATMRGNEWEMAQGCESTYGRFSYWMTDERTDDALSEADWPWREKGYEAYLKPRVNLRDDVPAAALDYLESKV